MVPPSWSVRRTSIRRVPAFKISPRMLNWRSKVSLEYTGASLVPRAENLSHQGASSRGWAMLTKI